MNNYTPIAESRMNDSALTELSNSSQATYVLETMDELNQRYVNTMLYLMIFLALLAPIGIAGNIIVLVVYGTSKTYKNNNFKIFVLWLAVVDLLSCLIIIPLEIISLIMIYSYRSEYLCKIKCFFQLFFNIVIGFALLVIAIERYIKICRPLQRQINRGLAKKIVIFVIVFCVLICVPAPFMCGISVNSKQNKYDTNTEVMMCAVEKRYENSAIRMVYKSTLSLLLLLNSVTIMVLYGLILRTTCIVRRRFLSQKRTYESVKMSNELINKIIDADTPLTNSKESLPNELPCQSEYAGQAVELTEDAIVVINGEQQRGDSCVINGEQQRGDSCVINGEQQRGDSCVINGEQQRGDSCVLNGKVIATLNHNGGSANNSGCTIRPTNSKVSTIKGRENSSIRLQQRLDCGISSKTLIWLILTVVYIVTYFLYSILAFYTTTQYRMSTAELVFYKFLIRIYLINNVINPVIYALLDERFRASCRHICNLIKKGICC